jgi:hypothetical protein
MPTTPPLSAARHADAPKVHHEQQAKQAAGDPAQQHDRRAPLFARDRRPRFICALGLHTAQDSAAPISTRLSLYCEGRGEEEMTTS